MRSNTLFIIFCGILFTVSHHSNAFFQYQSGDIEDVIKVFNKTSLKDLFSGRVVLRSMLFASKSDMEFFHNAGASLLQNPRLQQALKQRLENESLENLSSALNEYRAYTKEIADVLQKKEAEGTVSPELRKTMLDEIAQYESIVSTAISQKKNPKSPCSASLFSRLASKIPGICMFAGFGVLTYYAYNAHKKAVENEAAAKLKNNVA